MGLLVFLVAGWNAEDTDELALAERIALDEVFRCASVDDILSVARHHSAGCGTRQRPTLYRFFPC